MERDIKRAREGDIDRDIEREREQGETDRERERERGRERARERGVDHQSGVSPCLGGHVPDTHVLLLFQLFYFSF